MSDEPRKSARELNADWIADGTPKEEPVTVETPVEEVVDESSAAAAATDEAGQETSPETVEETAVKETQEVAPALEMFKGLLGEDEYEIPKDFKVPLKRGEDVEYIPVEELTRRGMMEKDYRLKTSEVAQSRRELEARETEFAAQQARVAEREKWLKEQESEMREALKDPDKWASFQEMQRAYAENPRFRQALDDALDKRETAAELEVYRSREDQRAFEQGVTMARDWITELAGDQRFASVNADRVAQVYGAQLKTGHADLSREAVERVFASEAQYLTSSLSPLQSQLEELKSQISALQENGKADQHNQNTQHALNRKKAPDVTPKGTPPGPKVRQPVERFGINDLVRKNQEWVEGKI